MLDGLILGLSSTVGCLSVCGPFLLPLLLTSAQKPISAIIKFLLGRLIAYTFFAVFAGYIGIYFEGRINPDIYYSLTIVLAIWLILYSLGKMQLKNPVCEMFSKNISEKNLPFLMGIVLGLNLCPPFLLGLDEVLKFANILKSLIFFAGFYIGSSLWTFILLFAGRIQNQKTVSLIGQILGILVGLYFLWKGIKGFI